MGGLAARDPEAETWTAGGWPLKVWLEMWEACYEAGFNGPIRKEWPDGRPPLEQPAVTVAMFALIDEGVAKHMEHERGHK